MDAKTHWSKVYSTKLPDQVSWYQERPKLSLELIRRTGIPPSANIIDVGGGASALVDNLLDSGFQNVMVLDIAGEALKSSQKRLGAKGKSVEWVEADITNAKVPQNHFDLWHDRAVFHFLALAEDRRRYVDRVRHSLKKGGHIIIASFSLQGPPRCSGLDIVRYSPETMTVEFGNEFELIESVPETHHTPSGGIQEFVYCLFRLSGG